MKRLLLMVLCGFVCVGSNAHAQTAAFIYRPTPVTIGVIPGQAGTSTSALVDSFGRQILSPSSSTSSTISPTKGAITHTQPTVAQNTSTTCLAANANRNYFLIQNNTAANIMINLSGTALTGIVPGATNLGIVITPGSNYESPPNFIITSAVTCYQGGASTNAISVMEG